MTDTIQTIQYADVHKEIILNVQDSAFDDMNTEFERILNKNDNQKTVTKTLTIKKIMCLLFLIYSQAAYCQIWQNVTPYPENFPFQVSIPDTMHLRGITSRNYLYYFTNSDDGGNTWTVSDLGRKLTGVDFPNAQHGWVQGDSGRLFHTSDGCLSWDTLLLPVNNIFHLKFFDDTTGYLYSTDADTLYLTTDGGHSWSTILTGLDVSSYIYFYNSTHAWSFVDREDKIYRTTNGGQTWDSVNLPVAYSRMKLQFIDSNTVFVGGVWPSNFLMLTTDGGLSWRIKNNFNLYDFIFKDTLNGIYNSGLVDYIYSTNNSGQSGILTDSLLGDFLVVQGKYYVTGPSGTSVSFNGINWKQICINNFPDYMGNNYVNYPPKFAFKTASMGYYISGDQYYGQGFIRNNLFFTTDSGKTWAGGNIFPVCSDFTMVSDSLWYFSTKANGNGGLYKSTDELKTYSRISEIIEPNNIYFFDSLNGVASDGNTYITTDGGNNWTPVNTATNSNFSFINSQFGWAANGDQILKSVNAGLTWTGTGNINIQINAGDIPHIQFTDSLHGFYTLYSQSDSSVLYKTVDGGNSFMQIIVPVSFFSSYFIDSIHGWIAGSNGIYYTNDGGINFIQQNNKNVDLISFYDSVNAYAEGSALVIKSNQSNIILDFQTPTHPQSSINLFPNPVSNYFQVYNPGNVSNIIIENESGKIVLSYRTSDPIIKVDMNGLSAGIYCLRVIFEKTIINKLIIKY